MERIKKMHEEYTRNLREWEKSYQLYLWSRWMYSSLQQQQAHSLNNRQATHQPTNTTATSTAPNNRQTRPTETVLMVACSPAPLPLRFLAEFADALVLVLVKAITLAIVAEVFQLENAGISFRLLLTDTSASFNDDFTSEDLQNMILIAFIYRVLTCLYEAVFLHYRGSTPGKAIFGLQVIGCKRCLRREGQPLRRDARNNLLLVSPGSRPSLYDAWLRSVIKNFSLAFMVPAFITMFFYRNRRTSYDVLSNTIVVKKFR